MAHIIQITNVIRKNKIGEKEVIDSTVIDFDTPSSNTGGIKILRPRKKKMMELFRELDRSIESEIMINGESLNKIADVVIAMVLWQINLLQNNNKLS